LFYFGAKSFQQLDISSSIHIVNFAFLPFNQIANSPTCHITCMAFNQLALMNGKLMKWQVDEIES